jgi:hypothetical protein
MTTHGVGFVIRDLYAFLAVHADGDEGVVGAQLGDRWLPLVVADPMLLEILRPIAQAAAREIGVTIRLVRFTQREELEVLRP